MSTEPTAIDEAARATRDVPGSMVHGERVVVLDFGSQYTQLIARRVREQQVYCEILPYDTPAATIAARAPRGIVLSGGPASVHADDGPLPDPAVFALGVPVLGICYGLQAMAHMLGGRVEHGDRGEYGMSQLEIVGDAPLFAGVPPASTAWMSHWDTVTALPPGWRALARTGSTEFAAAASADGRIAGLQFHPEVLHTAHGGQILHNFLFAVCGARGEWSIPHYVDEAIAQIRAQAGEGSGKVICALSGGVDSTVAASLVHRAIGERLVSIFVDHGLNRLAEPEAVVRFLTEQAGLAVRVVDARARFLHALAGVTDPEQKRKIIGREFIAVFEEEADAIGGITSLVQGTLYPDVIESVSVRGPSATIKSHHNVGGLPDAMRLSLIEPLRELFKDEVRELGRHLGLPASILGRHPFPGPGLAVRVLGEITDEALDTLRQADAVYIDEIRQAGLYDSIWQAFAVLLPVRTVGVMGDVRTYDRVLALRAVTSTDGMTADWFDMPHAVLRRIANRIVNEVPGVNRVVYDISSKPPSTIEWE